MRTLLPLLLVGACKSDPIDVTYDLDSTTPTPPDSNDSADSGGGDDSDTSPAGPQPTVCTVAVVVSWQLVFGRVEMATGAWTETWRYADERILSSPAPGLAFDGSVWAFFLENESDHLPTTLDPLTGVLTMGAEAPSMADSTGLAWDGSRWLGATSVGLSTYNSTEDFLAGNATFAALLNGLENHISWSDGEIYGTNWSADVVSVYDGSTYDWQRTIVLEDFDTWVNGISVAGGKIHLLDDGRQTGEQRLMSFDPATGAVLETVSPVGPGATVAGLWCEVAGT